MFRWIISVLLALSVVAACGEARIPALTWEPRSDWLNVRDVGAKGDGVADDTAALQQAFDRVADGTDYVSSLRNRVVYLPAGHYRLTKTVTLAKEHGGWIVGDGRNTVLVWDGEEDGTMTLSNGATYTRYEGITWDGQGRAAVGMEHSSQSYYETSLRYEHCAFLNLRRHGILNGRGKEKAASAEIWFLNCLFRRCGAGVSLLNFNDYDNTFDGCQFEDCGTGVNSVNGNFYIRACRFERSTQVDVRQARPSHASSLRLCTSQGSRRFFETGAGMHQSIKIQDCRVDGWTDPDGAIQLGQRGPTIISDCVFTNPPGKNPPIKLYNPKETQQLALLCNNSSRGTNGVINKGMNARVTEVPAGKRAPALTTATRSFLRENVAPQGKVFDVVRDFKANREGTADATDAFQQAIDAAKAHGNGAVVYLPSGQYRISKTLQLTGGHYRISGTGFRSIINWAGPKDGEMMRVHQPQEITLEHFQLSGPDETTRIHQTADKGTSLVAYDGVYLNSYDAVRNGLWLDRLPKGAVVRMGHLIGTLHLTDCGAAEVLCAIHFYGLTIEGATQPKTGIAGFMFHNDAGHNYALEVLDNQNVIVADFYSESNKRYLLAEGKDGQQPGRITIGASKLSTIERECVTMRNYRGRIFIGGGDGWYQSEVGKALSIVHEGQQPVDFILAGNGWWNVEPEYTFGPGMRYAGVENLLIENDYPKFNEKSLPNISTPTTQPALIAAFDDFRELATAYLAEYFHEGK